MLPPPLPVTVCICVCVVQDGETAVHFAARYGYIMELRYIVKRGAYTRALSSVSRPSC
jgi:hypothetical protein